MIILTEQQTSQAFQGQHGWYVKLSPSVGVKVIKSSIYKSKAKAYKSRAYRLATQESANLQLAFETGVVPRCYGVTIVKVKRGYQVGILMQHLGTLTLSNSEFYDTFDIYEGICDKLEEVGIYHQDLHEDNVMVYRNKFYAIDFSPLCVTLDE